MNVLGGWKDRLYGSDLLQSINKDIIWLKIILISVYVLDYALVQELEENKYIAKYIEKPVHLHSLIEVVSETVS